MPAIPILRAAHIADIPLIQSLADRIWRESYAAMLPAAQINYMLQWMYGGETIAAEMERGVVWQVAESQGDAVGYCSATFHHAGVAELNKLYLLPASQGRGWGQAMLSHVAAVAEQRGCKAVRLRVNKTNARALRAYERAGFTIVDALVAEIGEGFIMDDYVLERRLGTLSPSRPDDPNRRVVSPSTREDDPEAEGANKPARRDVRSRCLIKICGLSTPETLAAALEAGADWVGFVFFPRSPRHVSFEQARDLAAQARGRAAIVALTVDADDAMLTAIVAAAAPDWLQLHGHETPARVAAVKARFGLPVLKAIGVSSAADVAAASIYADEADMLLFDAKPPTDATLPGGNGVPFDWTLLRGVSVPFMLSGGLSADNAAEALRISGATGVDVSSGVERSPGLKDAGKIRAFVAAVSNVRGRTRSVPGDVTAALGHENGRRHP